MGEQKRERRMIVLSETGKKRLGFAENLPAMIRTSEHLIGSSGDEVQCMDMYGKAWFLTTEDIDSIRP